METAYQMMQHKFVHVVVTRFGLGRRDEAFYRQHLNLCGLTLAPSLRAQIDQDFIWAVAIDARAPEWVDAAIKKLAGAVRTVVWRLDPLVTGFYPIDFDQLGAIANGRWVATSRIDDDDLLHSTYTTAVASHFDGRTKPTAISFAGGVYLSAGSAASKRYPWMGAGIALLSPPSSTRTIYNGEHNRMGEWTVAEGGESVVVDDGPRMWIRTMRHASDSGAVRGTRMTASKRLRFRPRDYGIGYLQLLLLRLHLAGPAVDRQSLTQDRPLPSLFMKMELHALIREQRQKPDDPLKAVRIEALANALYSI